jgi:imidazolonepropionase-like amidohydrolase
MRSTQLWLAAALAALPAALPAADLPRVHALTGARIVVRPGTVIEAGTVVLRDGVIEAVGAGIEPPPDARLWDAKGLTVYPGLIETYAVRPWPEAKDGSPAQTGHPNPLVHPERDVALHPLEESAVAKLREAGFTTALVVPGGGLFRGRSALLNLGDGTLERNLLRRGVAQHVTIKPQTGEDAGYPDSLMGAVALFRQTLLDAGWQAAAHAAYSRNPAQRRPPLSPALSALGPAAAGDEIVVFETEHALDTLRAAALARELRLRAWVVGNGEEYQRLAEIEATGLPQVLPLAFPKPPQPPKPLPAVAGGAEAAPDPTVELDELRHWDLAPENPGRLLATRLPVAFTSHRQEEPRKLYEHLHRALGHGLTADQALAALTVTPARLLGIDQRTGTVERGKMANLVVVEGDLFVERPKIRAVWVDGARHEVKEREKPEVDPAGTWDLVVKTPEGEEIPVTIELTGKPEALRGTAAAMGQTADLVAAEVSGKSLELSFDGAPFGMPGTITMTLEISGDSATGSGTAPQGPFTVSGSRSKKPEAPR